MIITKETMDNKFDELKSISDSELEKKVDDAAVAVFDELRVLVEQLTCNNNLNNTHLIYEARFQENFNELRWLCYEKMARAKNK